MDSAPQSQTIDRLGPTDFIAYDPAATEMQ